MGVPKRLTEKQLKFANLIIANEGRKTATECAVLAGYDEESAYVRASELQNPKKYPLVVEYIGKRRSEMLKKYDISYDKDDDGITFGDRTMIPRSWVKKITRL